MAMPLHICHDIVALYQHSIETLGGEFEISLSIYSRIDRIGKLITTVTVVIN